MIKAADQAAAESDAQPISVRWSRHARPLAFAAILSALNSLLVSGASTLRVIGLHAALTDTSHWVGLWMRAYSTSWPLAFPAVLILTPPVRRIVDRLFPTLITDPREKT